MPARVQVLYLNDMIFNYPKDAATFLDPTGQEFDNYGDEYRLQQQQIVSDIHQNSYPSALITTAFKNYKENDPSFDLDDISCSINYLHIKYSK